MSRRTLQLAGLAALPVVLLALLAVVLVHGGLLDFMRRGVPPIEELTFERVVLAPGTITVDVVNGGPDPVTVAQVLVDEAFWEFSITPDATVERLERARIEIPYPWVQDETHEVTILSSTGLTFTHEIAVAVATPEVGARYLGIFTLIGLYVGVIPVAIGLLWYPMLRRLAPRWIHFALAVTAGLLMFLAVDALGEAFETAGQVAGAFQGSMMVVIAVLATVLALEMISRSRLKRGGADGRRTVALLVALGIGLHNMGEGLAIGAAYALGEAALGAFLIVGFMLHNTTEGLGIVAPIASDRPKLTTLGALGLLAGGPTIVGAWIGGLAYTALLSTLFLAVGAGAIAQVVLALYRVVARDREREVWNPLAASGVLAGLVIMYATGLLVAA